MDLLVTLREWSPLLAPITIVIAVPLLRWMVGSTLASKDDLAKLAASTHADRDEEAEKIGDLNTRVAVVERDLAHVKNALQEVATKRDVSDIRDWIKDIKVDLTRIERHLLKETSE